MFGSSDTNLDITAPTKLKLQIHVHTPTLDVNKRFKKDAPCVVIIRKDRPDEIFLCREVKILGKTRFVHGKKNRSLQGATVWIETSSRVLFKTKRRTEWQQFSSETPTVSSAVYMKELQKKIPAHC